MGWREQIADLPADFRREIIATSDAAALRRSAAIMAGRSSKPTGLAMSVLCKLLEDQASKIERGR